LALFTINLMFTVNILHKAASLFKVTVLRLNYSLKCILNWIITMANSFTPGDPTRPDLACSLVTVQLYETQLNLLTLNYWKVYKKRQVWKIRLLASVRVKLESRAKKRRDGKGGSGACCTYFSWKRVTDRPRSPSGRSFNSR
jgi:hypothetical protein